MSKAKSTTVNSVPKSAGLRSRPSDRQRDAGAKQRGGTSSKIQSEPTAASLKRLVKDIRACRICKETPVGNPIPHEPRPVVQVDHRARLVISGQAPGTRVHASGRPFTDPSGERLRAWMGIEPDVFYDASRVAIIPMGFCFPGLDGKGGDLPPRRECATAWRARLLAQLPEVELLLVVGQYAQNWHLAQNHMRRKTLTETVRDWQSIWLSDQRPRLLPLPHPSWRNNSWLKANAWFETDLLPTLRAEVARLTA